MATVIARTGELPFELPGPSRVDDADPLGIRIGKPIHVGLLKRFGMASQTGTIWLGTWGIISVVTFIMGNFVLLWAGITLTQGSLWNFLRYFANVQELPPDGLGFAKDLTHGGFWQINLAFWVVSVAAWAARCLERLKRYQMRPFLFWVFMSAIFLTTVIWVIRPLLMGTWAEAPGLGLNVDLDWAQNFSVLWGNLYYNPWHMLAIFFLFGSVMLWGMHGATILATASEGSHMEDAEIKDMHSGSHKSMLFWRWVMGFNANPKTIHDWLLWFSAGTVLASGVGLLVTGTIVKDWYVWGVDHGWVQQYGPMTRSAINERPRPFAGAVTGDVVDIDSFQLAVDEHKHVDLPGITFATGSAQIQSGSVNTIGGIAQTLTNDPSLRLMIEGNTDDVGDAAKNLTLSKARAAAVKAMLVSNYHIGAGRLDATGFGDTMPIVQNDSDAARAQNRRIDVVREGD